MINLDSYSVFAENKTTLRETSRDDSDAANVEYMTDSDREAVNFDLVKRGYANGLGLSEECAASVDAIVPFQENIAFIEFKNGKVNNRNVKDKARDTLLIFSDITGQNISDTRRYTDLIVVYNSEKNPLPNQMKKGFLQETPSRIAIGEYFSSKAQKELILFDLEKYQRIYFRKVHTYTKEKFETYLEVNPI